MQNREIYNYIIYKMFLVMFFFAPTLCIWSTHIYYKYWRKI